MIRTNLFKGLFQYGRSITKTLSRYYNDLNDSNPVISIHHLKSDFVLGGI